MRKKLDCILLIDDDKPTNYFHKIIINDSGLTERVIAIQSGQEALEYLGQKEEGQYPRPDLIFLDINMPAMDGWEFLEEYNKLDKNKKAKILIIMLTTSINPEDEKKAKEINLINGFQRKPLSVEMLEKIIDNNF